MKQQRSLEARQVARVYRALADEHVENRTKDDGEALWARVASRRASLALVTPAPRPRWYALAGAAATCLVLLGAGWFLWQEEPRALEFEVLGGEQVGQLVATEGTPATLSFSDRSRVVLEPHTTLRVEIVEPAQVIGHLSQGVIEVSVHHGPSTDYRFLAGPFEVQVVGTVFRVDFDPSVESMKLTVDEGRVRVRNGEQIVFVSAGEERSFVSERGARALAEKRDAGASRAAVTLEELDGLAHEAERRGEEKHEAALDPGARPSTPAVPSFARLASAGRFGEVVRLAEARGIDRVLAEKGPEELQELAQAARYTGRSALAERVWRHLWSKASGRAVGVDAAFFLGRLADQTGRSAEALEWLRAYLAKAPQGTYAAESMGRELLIVQRRDGATAARPVARRYLARFPAGAYAAQARALLSEPE